MLTKKYFGWSLAAWAIYGLIPFSFAAKPKTDIYSESLYLERSSAEVPSSLELSESKALISDESPIESIEGLERVPADTQSKKKKRI